MADAETEVIVRFHRSLVDNARDRPEYQPGQESALYGYSEGVEHGMELLLANGYRKIEYAREFEDLRALPVGVSIFDGTATFTVGESQPTHCRSWVGHPNAGWFPETVDGVAPHLPAIVLRPRAAAAAPEQRVLAAL